MNQCQVESEGQRGWPSGLGDPSATVRKTGSEPGPAQVVPREKVLQMVTQRDTGNPEQTLPVANTTAPAHSPGAHADTENDRIGQGWGQLSL